MIAIARAARSQKKDQTPSLDANFVPSVTIIVAAYNEEKNIAKTLTSLQVQDYPQHRFNIEVFSDGSTDQTDQIVKKFAQQGIRLVRFEGRIGKTECQNRMVARATSDVVAFADGNLRWDKKSLRALVAPFVDKQVASTTGTLVLTRDGHAEEAEANEAIEEKINEGLFRIVDEKIKAGESIWLSTIGVNGPIYAVRRERYIKLRPWLVSDLVLPFLLVAQGFKVMRAHDAVAYEPASTSMRQEFNRKRRLVTQGFVALPTLWRAAWHSGNQKLQTMLIAHKVLRWLGAELLISAFLLSVALAVLGQGAPLGIALFFISLAIVGLVVPKATKSLPGSLAMAYFVVTNAASLLGLIDYVRGRRAATWNTVRQGEHGKQRARENEENS